MQDAGTAGTLMESRYRHKRPLSAEKRATSSVAAPLSGPRTARFLDESETAYLVGEPRGPQRAWVPKQRAAEESFLLERRHRGADVWLLRWSAYAVLGVACGGVVGVLLGGLVVVAALVRLAQFSRRVSRWRRRHRGLGAIPPLPAAATAERSRLLAAVGQGLLAILLGGLVFLVLAGLL